MKNKSEKQDKYNCDTMCVCVDINIKSDVLLGLTRARGTMFTPPTNKTLEIRRIPMCKRNNLGKNLKKSDDFFHWNDLDI